MQQQMVLVPLQVVLLL